MEERLEVQNCILQFDTNFTKNNINNFQILHIMLEYLFSLKMLRVEHTNMIKSMACPLTFIRLLKFRSEYAARDAKCFGTRIITEMKERH